MSEPLVLVKFDLRIPRMGRLTSLFVTTQTELDANMELPAYLDDALGKHSSITVYMTKENTKVVSREQDLIGMMLALDILPIGYDLVEIAAEQKTEREPV
jgi:hypothetical protein